MVQSRVLIKEIEAAGWSLQRSALQGVITCLSTRSIPKRFLCAP